MEMRQLGDRGLLIRGLAASRWKQAERFAAALGQRKPAGVLEIVPAFDSVAVLYDPLAFQPDQSAPDLLGEWVLRVFESSTPPTRSIRPREVEIPVRYGKGDGPDLEEVARTLKRTAAQIIHLHTAGRYRVLAIGFMPGFAYLGGLAEELKLPRRAAPRTCVPAGAVGLGGPYTGIYPLASPGGWHLIGQTATRLFDPDTPGGALLRVGDVVRFVAIEEGR